MKFEDILSEELLNEMSLDYLTKVLSDPEKLNNYYKSIKAGRYNMVGKERFVTDSSNKKLSRQYVENSLYQKGIIDRSIDREKLNTILNYYCPSFS